jgi:molybdate transport repressor ModE-like protein
MQANHQYSPEQSSDEYTKSGQPNWLGLELRHLVALKAIAEEGTFGRAAQRLGYTQSAISQQIATLERIVGQRLIERPGGPRPVSLTEAGELLLRHADAIAARLQAAQADLAALDAGDAGPLRIGTYQSVGAKVLPGLLREFTAEWPQVEVTLRESADDAELIQQVERGELDLSFVVLPLGPGPYETVELMRDPYVLIVPPGSKLAEDGRVPKLRDILDHPLIGFRTCRTTRQVEDRLRQAGSEPQIVFRSDDNGTVQGLVAAGVGLAIVPRLTVDPTDESVEVIDLGDRVPPRLIGIAWHRDRRRTRAAEAFVELARALTAGPELATSEAA